MGCCGDCCVPPKESRDPIKFDPEFSGPVKNRSCTDILWLLIFIIFLAGWVFVGYYGIYNGDVQRLLAPTDSQGRKCGLDSGLIDKPYLVFFDITQCLSPNVPFTGCPTPQVCVEKCPDETIIFAQQLQINPGIFNELRSKLVCQYNVEMSSITSASVMLELISSGQCTSYVLKSQSVLFRCIGDLSTLSCKGRTSASTRAPTVSGREPLAAVRRYFSNMLDPQHADRSLQPLSEAVCVRDPQKAQSTLLSRATALDTYVGMIAASWVTFFAGDRPEVQNISTMIVEDLVSSRWYLLGALFAVILLCFLYIVLLRWVVAPVVWVSIVGLIALMSFTVYLCWKNYAYYKANPVTLHQTSHLQGWAESMFFKKETWMVLLVIVAILTVILLLMVIFLRKRITIAIALIEEGSKAVSSNKSTVVYPILPWLLQLGVIAFGIIVLMYLMSIGESQYRAVGLEPGGDCTCTSLANYDECTPATFGRECHSISTGGACQNASCHFIGIEGPTYVTYMHIVNAVGFFWLMFFIQGMADMTLAGTFATWYWTWNKRDLPFFTLTGGIYRSVRYHMGTVALGSLIITIVRLIRLVLEYIDQKLKKFDNAFTRCLLCLCKCCFLCLENFLKFINKNAYIMCAVHGNNFCTSARDAFSLLMRNIVRVFVLDKVTDFIFLVSKLLISAGVGFAVYYLLQWQYLYTSVGAERLHYNLVPALILTLAAFLVTTLFFNVYAVAVDTLFLCFLEDCERNDGSAEKPYFMSRNLMKILGKRNKAE